MTGLASLRDPARAAAYLIDLEAVSRQLLVASLMAGHPSDWRVLWAEPSPGPRRVRMVAGIERGRHGGTIRHPELQNHAG